MRGRDPLNSSSRFQGNLLAHVVTTVGRRQAENLTTAALLYLLEKYESARMAFIQLLRVASGIDLPDELWFQFHASETGGRIPDIAAVDFQGRERVLIEVKLTAGLGPQQALDYFERLPATMPSALCILAPGRRIPFLWFDARRQIPELRDDDEPSAARRASRGSRVLTALSWNHLLTALESSLANSPDGHAEIAQLRGVSEFYDRRDFLPFSSDDLAIANGMLIQQLSNVTEEVNQICLAEGLLVDSKATIGTQRGLYHGFWSVISGYEVWFGLWTAAWVELAETPFWLQFYDRSILSTVAHALRPLNTAGLPKVFKREAHKDVAVALYPPLGASEEQTVLNLVAQIREVHRCIEQLAET